MRLRDRLARGAMVAALLVTASQAAAVEIVSARYDGPTTRYPHGVLGDDIEYDSLVGCIVTRHIGECAGSRIKKMLNLHGVSSR